jgi:glutamine synthetase
MMGGRPTEAADVATWLQEAGVAAVACGFVDPSMIVRTKAVPIARFAEVAAAGVGLSTLFNVAMSNDRFALLPGYIDGPSGDLRLRPDPSATVPLAAMPGWAWAPVEQFTIEGEPYPGCPRAFTRRIADAYAERDISLKAVFEFEFSVGTKADDGSFVPAHEGPGYSDIALVRNHDFALDLLTTAEAQGLGLQQLHPEYANGQFEMSIAPRDPLGAADAAMVVRQTVRAVARRHGLVASFAPQVGPETGNGLHVHFSLWEGDRSLMSGGDGAAGMHERGESFVAGLLRELPAVVGVTVPTCLGYVRLQPHHWSGAMNCWGPENREASLRFIAGPTEATAGTANIEVKPIDGTANPYLALGALLAAGLHGLDEGLRLPPFTEEDPEGLPDDVKAARGVERLPASLAEAADRLAASSVLREAMGDFLFETYVATRRGEVEQYAGLDDEELIRRLRWRY